MNILKAFNFKVKEVIGYTEHLDKDPEDYDDAVVISVDIYLSGGQIFTLDLADDPIDSENLMGILGFDENYWNTLYGKDINPTNLCRSAMKPEIKSKSTYNPYE